MVVVVVVCVTEYAVYDFNAIFMCFMAVTFRCRTKCANVAYLHVLVP